MAQDIFEGSNPTLEGVVNVQDLKRLLAKEPELQKKVREQVQSQFPQATDEDTAQLFILSTLIFAPESAVMDQEKEKILAKQKRFNNANFVMKLILMMTGESGYQISQEHMREAMNHVAMENPDLDAEKSLEVAFDQIVETLSAAVETTAEVAGEVLDAANDNTSAPSTMAA